MRQELQMIKTSPRMMIGYGGDSASVGQESPSKAVSDVFSVEEGRSAIQVDSQPTPIRQIEHQGSMSP